MASDTDATEDSQKSQKSKPEEAEEEDCFVMHKRDGVWECTFRVRDDIAALASRLQDHKLLTGKVCREGGQYRLDLTFTKDKKESGGGGATFFERICGKSSNKQQERECLARKVYCLEKELCRLKKEQKALRDECCKAEEEENTEEAG